MQSVALDYIDAHPTGCAHCAQRRVRRHSSGNRSDLLLEDSDICLPSRAYVPLSVMMKTFVSVLKVVNGFVFLWHLSLDIIALPYLLKSPPARFVPPDDSEPF